MNIKFELYEEHLLIDAEAVIYAPKVSEYGNVYGVEGAGLADLPTLETIDISDTDTVADVSVKLNEMLYDMDLNGCRVGEALEISEDFDVVYSPLWQKFLLVSDMNSYPVYPYWDKDKEDFKCVWLPKPDAIVEIEEDEEPFSLDTWDGRQWRHEEVGCHADYYHICRLDGEPVKDKVLLRYWSERDGDQPSGKIISEEELEEIKAGE